MSEYGNGHGWSPRYVTSLTSTPTSSCHLTGDRRGEPLTRLDEAREHRDRPVPATPPRASRIRSSVVDDGHDHGHVGARVVLAAVGRAAADPAGLASARWVRRSVGSGRGCACQLASASAVAKAEAPRSSRSAPTWRRVRQPRPVAAIRRLRLGRRRRTPTYAVPSRPRRGRGPAHRLGRVGARRSRAGERTASWSRSRRDPRPRPPGLSPPAAARGRPGRRAGAVSSSGVGAQVSAAGRDRAQGERDSGRVSRSGGPRLPA